MKLSSYLCRADIITDTTWWLSQHPDCLKHMKSKKALLEWLKQQYAPAPVLNLVGKLTDMKRLYRDIKDVVDSGYDIRELRRRQFGEYEET